MHVEKIIQRYPPLYFIKDAICFFILVAICPFLSSSKVITEAYLPIDRWLLGGTLGSRNAILVFRSSALANNSDLFIQSKPGYKLHITYKVLQAESKLLAKLLDCHGIREVSNNSSDFNLLWTGSHPKPGLWIFCRRWCISMPTMLEGFF